MANGEQLPSFNPAFVDYGYNRAEWVAHLRTSGFEFSVLSNAWAFHSRHSPWLSFRVFIGRSEYKLLYGKKSDATKGIRGGVDTKKIFDRMMKKYASEALPGTLPFCKPQETTDASEQKEVKKEVKRRIIRRGNRVP